MGVAVEITANTKATELRSQARSTVVALPVEIDGYDQLHSILRSRARELALTREDTDELAGLTSGYSGKVLGPAKTKRIGPVSWALFKALGLKVVVVADDEALRRTRRRTVGGPPRGSLTRKA